MTSVGRKTLPHTKLDHLQTYRVETARYVNGRYTDKRKYLIPGSSQQDAEQRARKRWPNESGKSGKTGGVEIRSIRKVANYWREYD